MKEASQCLRGKNSDRKTSKKEQHCASSYLLLLLLLLLFSCFPQIHSHLSIRKKAVVDGKITFPIDVLIFNEIENVVKEE